MERHGTEPSQVPERVSWKDLNEALEPFFELLGTHRRRVFDAPGIHLQGNIITLTLAGPVETAAAARPVVVGEFEVQEAATEVRVVVTSAVREVSTADGFDARLDAMGEVVEQQAKDCKRLLKRAKRQEKAIERATERGSKRGTRDGAHERRRNGGR